MKAPPRPSMGKARRLRLWERDGGICYLCEAKVKAGEAWDIEHIIPWALSQDDSDENLRVAHKEGCHRAKTTADIGRITKAKRQGLETGQQARRKKRGHGSIKSGGGFPKGQKPRWPKRKLQSRNTFKRKDMDK